MILGAGLGVRMRPLTLKTPKPLLPLGRQPIIDRLIDKLVAAGFERAVVNVHHLAGKMRDHLSRRADIEIVISDESEGLLDSGGGVRKALPHLGAEPFLVLNGDSVWIDTFPPVLKRLIEQFDPETMDFLMLFSASVQSIGYEGPGDYDLMPDGRARRRRPSHQAAFVYAGVHALHPRVFRDAPEGPFSLNRLWDRAQDSDRLFGLRHHGPWLHAGTPEALDEIEKFLAGY